MIRHHIIVTRTSFSKDELGTESKPLIWTRRVTEWSQAHEHNRVNELELPRVHVDHFVTTTLQLRDHCFQRSPTGRRRDDNAWLSDITTHGRAARWNVLTVVPQHAPTNGFTMNEIHLSPGDR